VGIQRKLATVLAVLCLGSILGACVPSKPPPPPGPELPPPPPDVGLPPNSPDLTKSDILTGLSNPWDIGFLPGDTTAATYFYTQRAGPVRVHINGDLNPDRLIVDPDDVSSFSESGMMGLAVDPNFASNNFLYTCYTSSNDNRLVRWTVNNTLDGIVGDGAVILQFVGSPFHDGCRIRFGPDGKLWATIGDAAIGELPQDLNSPNGKVLRINSDGSTPSDNPFVGLPVDDRIYTFGHRNPQGIAFQPGTNQPYSMEHGPNVNDEVNRLVAGGNSGWDPVPGYNQDVPMTDLQKFPDAMIPAWRSGDSFTLAPSGGTFLTGPQWKSWENQLVVAFLKDSKARVMFLDGNGDVAFATQILENGSRLRSAVQGPDGNLYITTDTGGGGDAIWKVVPS
jgi:aldose sugar dehydrogenase